jgi:hypothetical protein
MNNNINEELEYNITQQKIYSYYNYDKILLILFLILLSIYLFVIFKKVN